MRKRGTSERKDAILNLSLERQPFDEIAMEKKFREYREYKPYWTTRLEGRKYDFIRFRNGYGPRVPEMDVEYLGARVGTRRDGSKRYVIRLGKILTKKRWKAE